MHIHAKRTTKSHFVTPTQHHSLSSAMMQREGRNYKSEIRTPLFSPPGNLKFWIRMTHCRKPFHCLETEVYKGGGTSPSKPEEPVLVDKDCFCPEHVYTNFPVIIHISQQFAWHSYAICIINNLQSEGTQRKTGMMNTLVILAHGHSSRRGSL